MFIETETLVALAAELDKQESSAPDTAKFNPTKNSEYVQAWYTVLLQQTLEFAEQTVPYYRRRAAETGLNAGIFEKISDLQRYPILTRADIVNNYASFFSNAAVPEKASSTSGTTGRRLLIYGNREEDKAAFALRQIILSGDGNQPDPLTLRIIPGNRRTHISASSTNVKTNTVTVGYTPLQTSWFDHTDHILEVLSDTYYLGGNASRISIIHITPPVILDIITAQMLQRRIDPAIFGITDIAVSGAFMSRQTRHLIENVWKARAHHSYSCSEINGEAITAADDFDSFFVQKTMLCEILDVETRQPVNSGESGMVVLTSLYPFQQVMPLIRYSIGDIAQRCDDASNPFVTKLKPIGRLSECIRLGRRRFIGTRDCFHALTAFPEIPQIPYPRFELLCDKQKEESVLRLNIELTLPGYQPSLTEDQVAAQLSKEISSYNYRTDEMPQTVVCRFLPKNSLSGFPKIIPDR